MKKNFIVSLMVIVVLILSTTIGTLAYYTQAFKSTGNIISTAEFKIEHDGTLDSQKNFTVNKLAPGESGFYNFKINKTGTEVPLKYDISIEKSGELLSETSPIQFKLYRLDKENQNSVNYLPLESTNNGQYTYEILPVKNDIEEFQIYWKWNPNNNENDYKLAGKTGNVSINVVAEQIVENAINAEVYVSDESNNPSTLPVEQNKIVSKVTNGEKILTIKNNSYFGNVQFKIAGTKGNETATLVSSSKDKYINKVFSIRRKNSGCIEIKDTEPNKITIELKVPSGELDSLFN